MGKKILRVCHKYLLGEDGYDLSIRSEIKETNKLGYENYVMFFISRDYLDRFVKSRRIIEKNGYLYHPGTGAYLIPMFFEMKYFNFNRDLFMFSNVLFFIGQFTRHFLGLWPKTVHVHGTLNPQFLISAIYGRVFFRRTVATHHTGKVHYRSPLKEKLYVYSRTLMHNLMPLICHKMICKSDHGVSSFYFKKKIEKMYGVFNLEPKELTVNEINRILIKRSFFKRPIDVSKGKIFLYPARICYQKNQEMLIHAFGKLDGDNTLLLIGGKEQRDYVRRLLHLIGKKKLQDRIHVISQLPHSVLLSVMKKSSFLIISSFNENMPRCGLEAHSLGIPVLASNEGGHLELIDEGNDGLFFDPRNVDSIVEVIREGVDKRDQLIPNKIDNSYINKLVSIYEGEDGSC
jgi:glycosyltransferase involved in cell wall biosynthesis